MCKHRKKCQIALDNEKVSVDQSQPKQKIALEKNITKIFIENGYFPKTAHIDPVGINAKAEIVYRANEDLLTNQDGSIEQYIYYNDAGDRYVEHIKIIGGGHYWDDKLNYNGTNTSGLIWGFVSNYNIDGIID